MGDTQKRQGRNPETGKGHQPSKGVKHHIVNETPSERRELAIFGLIAVLVGLALPELVSSGVATVFEGLLVAAGVGMIVSGFAGYAPLYLYLESRSASLEDERSGAGKDRAWATAERGAWAHWLGTLLGLATAVIAGAVLIATGQITLVFATVAWLCVVVGLVLVGAVKRTRSSD